MGRQAGIALAAVLALAWAGTAMAQEAGDMPDLDVDISIDVVTDFEHMGPGADVGGLDHDEGDVHVVTPGEGDRHHGESAVGDHDGTEVGEHEAEMEGHETEVGGDTGAPSGGVDGGMSDGHEIETEH